MAAIQPTLETAEQYAASDDEVGYVVDPFHGTALPMQNRKEIVYHSRKRCDEQYDQRPHRSPEQLVDAPARGRLLPRMRFQRRPKLVGLRIKLAVDLVEFVVDAHIAPLTILVVIVLLALAAE
jgi:hypothetical protein